MALKDRLNDALNSTPADNTRRLATLREVLAAAEAREGADRQPKSIGHHLPHHRRARAEGGDVQPRPAKPSWPKPNAAKSTPCAPSCVTGAPRWRARAKKAKPAATAKSARLQKPRRCFRAPR